MCTELEGVVHIWGNHREEKRVHSWDTTGHLCESQHSHFVVTNGETETAQELADKVADKGERDCVLRLKNEPTCLV